MILLGLLACSGALPPLAAPEADVVARVRSAKVAAGEPVFLDVRTLAAEGWTVEPGTPAAEGLDITPAGEEGPVLSGDRQVRTWTWRLEGPNGSYVVEPGGAVARGPAGEERTLETPPIFLDIGVPGPSGGELADLEAAPPPSEPPWALVAGLAGAAALLGGGLWWWRSRRPAPPPPPPPPPHVVALAAWEEARRAGLDDHALALALSRILRAYLEAITGFPATARTTREILGHLGDQGRLGATDRLRAARVLDATDRLKFAREGGGEAFFAALDQDFRAVVEATRPAETRPEEPAHG